MCAAASSSPSQPASSSRARVRGCSGRTTASGSASSRSTSARRRAGSSTLPARWAVASAYSPAVTPASRSGASSAARARREEQRHVDHHVADELDPPGNVLALEVGDRGRRGAEQQVGEVVGEHAIELLGHRAIEGAHARLHMGDRHARLGRGQAAGQRRVRVPVDEDDVGALRGDERPQRGEHARRLLGVRAAVDAELALGARDAELGDEDRRQLVVVVLAGVHEQLVVLGAQQARDGSRLDELGPVSDDGEDAQASGGDAQLLLDVRADPACGLLRERAGHRRQRGAVDRAHRVHLAQRRGHERLAHVT